MIRLAVLFLALVATACSDSAPNVGAQFQTPSAITTFHGVTERHPGVVEPYVAVASSGSDQLTLIDPRDDRPVQSPGLVFPLAVPTDASPMFVAAVSLADGGADALVGAGAPYPATGEVALQLVATWDGKPRPVAPFPGGTASRGFPVGSGGEVILSLAGAPVPQAAAAVAGVTPPVAGVGRFLVSLSGGQLRVVRAVRQADGSIQLADEGAIPLGGATPFDAVALAPSPDGRHVYAASGDVITGTDGIPVLGVAELDTLGDDPAAWIVRALSARASTYGVAAARVIERSVDDADVFNREQMANLPRLLVYALPDRATCGPTRSIDCGIVTIDPVTGTLAEDPLGEMPYRAPMRLPVLPIAMATWDRPPEVKAAADKIGSLADEDAGLPAIELDGIHYTPGTGFRVTSAIAVATGADGRSYSIDLGRWGPGSDTSLLRSPSQTRVLNLVDVTDPSVDAQIGMWNEANPPTEDVPAPQLETTPAEMIAQMLVTPGYTPDDNWTLGWQYPLTGLQTRRSVLVRDGALGLVIAMQVPEEANGATTWRDAVGLFAPQLGVHVGDVVEVALDADAALPAACAAIGEGRVADILPPDPARWPGGALVLSPPVDPPTRTDETNREEVYACWAAQLAAGIHLGTATVFSGEWVLVGSSFGHAGRPQPNVRFGIDYPGRDAEGFVEERLEAACAIPSWPPPDPVPACDAACRETCEELAITRKSRRFYYPQEDCRELDSAFVGCAITGRPAAFDESILVGPVLEFRFGLNSASVTAEHPIVRAAHVSWSTASGLSESFRAPTSGGQATGVAGFDRSPFTNAEPRLVFYVSYTDDAIYEAAFGAFATESKTIR
jgi:hypothetical protein